MCDWEVWEAYENKARGFLVAMSFIILREESKKIVKQTVS